MAMRIGPGLAVLLFALPAVAIAAPKTAVMPFEITIDQPPDALPTMPVKPSAEESRRLEQATDQLRKALAETGQYDVVDLTPFAAVVKEAQPFFKCDGCEADLARKAGAELAVTGLVRKVTEALLSVSVELRAADTGKIARAGSVSFHENTDDGWARAVRWLVKNRLTPQGEAVR
jgi:hypothetical protein